MCYSPMLVWVSMMLWHGTTWALPASLQFESNAVDSPHCSGLTPLYWTQTEVSLAQPN